MLISGGAELLTLGAVLPFLAVLSDPELLWKQTLVKSLANQWGITNSADLVLPVSLVFSLAAIFAAAVRLANLWLNLRLAAAIGSDLSCEAYRRTLYQPYMVHIQRNSSEVITSTITMTSQTVIALNAILQIITSFTIATGVLLGLFLIDAPVAFSVLTIFSLMYCTMAFGIRRELRSNGKNVLYSSNQRLKTLQEGLGAIRDVLLDGSQLTYLNIYRNADLSQRRYQAKNTFLGSFPRYIIEALSILMIVILASILFFRRGSNTTVIPLLGVLALGSQRLLPAFQQIYSGWTAVRSYSPSIEGVLEMIRQPLPPLLDVVKPLCFDHSVIFKNVYFSYSPEQKDILRDLNFEIRAGERIGLIGTTGSGKSTTADLLMGLLEPTKGNIYVDGVDLHSSTEPELLSAWRSSISHVPQDIYLSDGTISENIAFGIPKNKIDMNRVVKAAQQAQISSFIEDSSEGYQTFVGERGIRLSGGQRQRIAIARAIYKQASMLVFDEATSALDTSTEYAVMDSIESLSNNLTIVLIAHRLSTVRRCSKVIQLLNGVIVAAGSPDDVLG